MGMDGIIIDESFSGGRGSEAGSGKGDGDDLLKTRVVGRVKAFLSPSNWCLRSSMVRKERWIWDFFVAL